MITGHLKINIYENEVYLIVSGELEKMEKFLNRKFKDVLFKTDPTNQACVYYDMGKYILHIDPKYLTHNTIAHEVYHLTQGICRRRAIDNEEAAAWLQGHLAEWVYATLKKKNIEVR